MIDTDTIKDDLDEPVFDMPTIDEPDISAAFAAQSGNPIWDAMLAELDDREV